MKIKRKKRPSKEKFCDPSVCDNCICLGKGDFLCDKYNEIVIEEWEPNENFLMRKGETEWQEQ